MKIEIKNRFTGIVIFEGEFKSLKECVTAAVKARANLAGANLADAYLTGANLTDANLTDANLTGANLTDANLTRAYLAGANLTDADLADANLTDANLTDANLTDANLTGAYLARAYLAGADLADAYLAGAYLARAYLADADLAGAYLAGAYLAGADLAGANLADANLAGANLADANLAGANLAGADLADAKNVPANTEAGPSEPYERKPTAERLAERAARYRARHPEVPVVAALDAKILSVLESNSGKLEMSAWHSCETTHCRAGWAITLAGVDGKELEQKYGPQCAGTMIYRASTGRVPHFFASNERALADIREQAATQTQS